MGPKLLMKVTKQPGMGRKLLTIMPNMAVILNVKHYAMQNLSATIFHTARNGTIVYYALHVISRRVEAQVTTHLGQKQVRGIQKAFSNWVII